MSSNQDDQESVRDRLSRCSSSDFQGHTEFAHLTPSQRLDALASLVAFVAECKGLAPLRRVEECSQHNDDRN
jgi:hypothetical protein